MSALHPQDFHDALDAAVSYLAKQRSASGWWFDFKTSEGISDEWVTAFTGAALARLPTADAQKLALDAWDRLARRRWWLSGWAYNFGVPLDADSTIWAVRLAEAVGARAHRRVQRAYRFIERHRSPGGGFSTYARNSPIYRHIGLPSKGLAIGWMSPHPCVTAAAAGLYAYQGDPEIENYLLAQQQDDGSWEAYWWSDPEYTTSMAVEAFSRSPNVDRLQPSIRRAVNWLSERIESGRATTAHMPEGSPFATACALTVLSTQSSRNDLQAVIESAAAWLIERQQEDGSWLSSARLRIPPPNLVDAGVVDGWQMRSDIDSGTIKLDQNAIYTTAAAASSLAAARFLVAGSSKHG